jgi:hypothetical protein
MDKVAALLPLQSTINDDKAGSAMVPASACWPS